MSQPGLLISLLLLLTSATGYVWESWPGTLRTLPTGRGTNVAAPLTALEPAPLVSLRPNGFNLGVGAFPPGLPKPRSTFGNPFTPFLELTVSPAVPFPRLTGTQISPPFSRNQRNPPTYQGSDDFSRDKSRKFPDDIRRQPFDWFGRAPLHHQDTQPNRDTNWFGPLRRDDGLPGIPNNDWGSNERFENLQIYQKPNIADIQDIPNYESNDPLRNIPGQYSGNPDGTKGDKSSDGPKSNGHPVAPGRDERPERIEKGNQNSNPPASNTNHSIGSSQPDIPKNLFPEDREINGRISTAQSENNVPQPTFDEQFPSGTTDKLINPFLEYERPREEPDFFKHPSPVTLNIKSPQHIRRYFANPDFSDRWQEPNLPTSNLSPFKSENQSNPPNALDFKLNTPESNKYSFSPIRPIHSQLSSPHIPHPDNHNYPGSKETKNDPTKKPNIPTQGDNPESSNNPTSEPPNKFNIMRQHGNAHRVPEGFIPRENTLDNGIINPPFSSWPYDIFPRVPESLSRINPMNGDLLPMPKVPGFQNNQKHPISLSYLPNLGIPNAQSTNTGSRHSVSVPEEISHRTPESFFKKNPLSNGRHPTHEDNGPPNNRKNPIRMQDIPPRASDSHSGINPLDNNLLPMLGISDSPSNRGNPINHLNPANLGEPNFQPTNMGLGPSASWPQAISLPAPGSLFGINPLNNNLLPMPEAPESPNNNLPTLREPNIQRTNSGSGLSPSRPLPEPDSHSGKNPLNNGLLNIPKAPESPSNRDNPINLLNPPNSAELNFQPSNSGTGPSASRPQNNSLPAPDSLSGINRLNNGPLPIPKAPETPRIREYPINKLNPSSLGEPYFQLTNNGFGPSESRPQDNSLPAPGSPSGINPLNNGLPNIPKPPESPSLPDKPINRLNPPNSVEPNFQPSNNGTGPSGSRTQDNSLPASGSLSGINPLSNSQLNIHKPPESPSLPDNPINRLNQPNSGEINFQPSNNGTGLSDSRPQHNSLAASGSLSGINPLNNGLPNIPKAPESPSLPDNPINRLNPPNTGELNFQPSNSGSGPSGSRPQDNSLPAPGSLSGINPLNNGLPNIPKAPESPSLPDNPINRLNPPNSGELNFQPSNSGSGPSGSRPQDNSLPAPGSLSGINPLNNGLLNIPKAPDSPSLPDNPIKRLNPPNAGEPKFQPSNNGTGLSDSRPQHNSLPASGSLSGINPLSNGLLNIPKAPESPSLPDNPINRLNTPNSGEQNFQPSNSGSGPSGSRPQNNSLPAPDSLSGINRLNNGPIPIPKAPESPRIREYPINQLNPSSLGAPYFQLTNNGLGPSESRQQDNSLPPPGSPSGINPLNNGLPNIPKAPESPSLPDNPINRLNPPNSVEPNFQPSNNGTGPSSSRPQDNSFPASGSLSGINPLSNGLLNIPKAPESPSLPDNPINRLNQPNSGELNFQPSNSGSGPSGSRPQDNSLPAPDSLSGINPLNNGVLNIPTAHDSPSLPNNPINRLNPSNLGEPNFQASNIGSGLSGSRPQDNSLPAPGSISGLNPLNNDLLNIPKAPESPSNRDNPINRLNPPTSGELYFQPSNSGSGPSGSRPQDNSLPAPGSHSGINPLNNGLLNIPKAPESPSNRDNPINPPNSGERNFQPSNSGSGPSGSQPQDNSLPTQGSLSGINPLNNGLLNMPKAPESPSNQDNPINRLNKPNLGEPNFQPSNSGSGPSGSRPLDNSLPAPGSLSGINPLNNGLLPRPKAPESPSNTPRNLGEPTFQPSNSGSGPSGSRPQDNSLSAPGSLSGINPLNNGLLNIPKAPESPSNRDNPINPPNSGERNFQPSNSGSGPSGSRTQDNSLPTQGSLSGINPLNNGLLNMPKAPESPSNQDNPINRLNKPNLGEPNFQPSNSGSGPSGSRPLDNSLPAPGSLSGINPLNNGLLPRPKAPESPSNNPQTLGEPTFQPSNSGSGPSGSRPQDNSLSAPGSLSGINPLNNGLLPMPKAPESPSNTTRNLGEPTFQPSNSGSGPSGSRPQDNSLSAPGSLSGINPLNNGLLPMPKAPESPSNRDNPINRLNPLNLGELNFQQSNSGSGPSGSRPQDSSLPAPGSPSGINPLNSGLLNIPKAPEFPSNRDNPVDRLNPPNLGEPNFQPSNSGSGPSGSRPLDNSLPAPDSLSGINPLNNGLLPMPKAPESPSNNPQSLGETTIQTSNSGSGPSGRLPLDNSLPAPGSLSGINPLNNGLPSIPMAPESPSNRDNPISQLNPQNLGEPTFQPSNSGSGPFGSRPQDNSLPAPGSLSGINPLNNGQLSIPKAFEFPSNRDNPINRLNQPNLGEPNFQPSNSGTRPSGSRPLDNSRPPPGSLSGINPLNNGLLPMPKAPESPSNNPQNLGEPTFQPSNSGSGPSGSRPLDNSLPAPGSLSGINPLNNGLLPMPKAPESPSNNPQSLGEPTIQPSNSVSGPSGRLPQNNSLPAPGSLSGINPLNNGLPSIPMAPESPSNRDNPINRLNQPNLGEPNFQPSNSGTGPSGSRPLDNSLPPPGSLSGINPLDNGLLPMPKAPESPSNNPQNLGEPTFQPSNSGSGPSGRLPQDNSLPAPGSLSGINPLNNGLPSIPKAPESPSNRDNPINRLNQPNLGEPTFQPSNSGSGPSGSRPLDNSLPAPGSLSGINPLYNGLPSIPKAPESPSNRDNPINRLNQPNLGEPNYQPSNSGSGPSGSRPQDNSLPAPGSLSGINPMNNGLIPMPKAPESPSNNPQNLGEPTSQPLNSGTGPSGSRPQDNTLPAPGSLSGINPLNNGLLPMPKAPESPSNRDNPINRLNPLSLGELNFQPSNSGSGPSGSRPQASSLPAPGSPSGINPLNNGLPSIPKAPESPSNRDNPINRLNQPNLGEPTFQPSNSGSGPSGSRPLDNSLPAPGSLSGINPLYNGLPSIPKAPESPSNRDNPINRLNQPNLGEPNYQPSNSGSGPSGSRPQDNSLPAPGSLSGINPMNNGLIPMPKAPESPSNNPQNLGEPTSQPSNSGTGPSGSRPQDNTLPAPGSLSGINPLNNGLLPMPKAPESPSNRDNPINRLNPLSLGELNFQPSNSGSGASGSRPQACSLPAPGSPSGINPLNSGLLNIPKAPEFPSNRDNPVDRLNPPNLGEPNFQPSNSGSGPSGSRPLDNSLPPPGSLSGINPLNNSLLPMPKAPESPSNNPQSLGEPTIQPSNSGSGPSGRLPLDNSLPAPGSLSGINPLNNGLPSIPKAPESPSNRDNPISQLNPQNLGEPTFQLSNSGSGPSGSRPLDNSLPAPGSLSGINPLNNGLLPRPKAPESPSNNPQTLGEPTFQPSNIGTGPSGSRPQDNSLPSPGSLSGINPLNNGLLPMPKAPESPSNNPQSLGEPTIQPSNSGSGPSGSRPLDNSLPALGSLSGINPWNNGLPTIPKAPESPSNRDNPINRLNPSNLGEPNFLPSNSGFGPFGSRPQDNSLPAPGSLSGINPLNNGLPSIPKAPESPSNRDSPITRLNPPSLGEPDFQLTNSGLGPSARRPQDNSLPAPGSLSGINPLNNGLPTIPKAPESPSNRDNPINRLNPPNLGEPTFQPSNSGSGPSGSRPLDNSLPAPGSLSGINLLNNGLLPLPKAPESSSNNTPNLGEPNFQPVNSGSGPSGSRPLENSLPAPGGLSGINLLNNGLINIPKAPVSPSNRDNHINSSNLSEPNFQPSSSGSGPSGSRPQDNSLPAQGSLSGINPLNNGLPNIPKARESPSNRDNPINRLNSPNLGEPNVQQSNSGSGPSGGQALPFPDSLSGINLFNNGLLKTPKAPESPSNRENPVNRLNPPNLGEPNVQPLNSVSGPSAPRPQDNSLPALDSLSGINPLNNGQLNTIPKAPESPSNRENAINRVNTTNLGEPNLQPTNSGSGQSGIRPLPVPDSLSGMNPLNNGLGHMPTAPESPNNRDNPINRLNPQNIGEPNFQPSNSGSGLSASRPQDSSLPAPGSPSGINPLNSGLLNIPKAPEFPSNRDNPVDRLNPPNLGEPNFQPSNSGSGPSGSRPLDNSLPAPGSLSGINPLINGPLPMPKAPESPSNQDNSINRLNPLNLGEPNFQPSSSGSGPLPSRPHDIYSLPLSSFYGINPLNNGRYFMPAAPGSSSFRDNPINQFNPSNLGFPNVQLTNSGSEPSASRPLDTSFSAPDRLSGINPLNNALLNIPKAPESRSHQNNPINRLNPPNLGEPNLQPSNSGSGPPASRLQDISLRTPDSIPMSDASSPLRPAKDLHTFHYQVVAQGLPSIGERIFLHATQKAIPQIIQWTMDKLRSLKFLIPQINVTIR